MNNFIVKVMNYYSKVGWETSMIEIENDGILFSVKNGNEKYNCFIYNKNTPLDKETSLPIFRKLEEIGKDGIVFAKKFSDDIQSLKEFSTTFTDENEIDYLIEKKNEMGDKYKHIQLKSHNDVAFKEYLKDKLPGKAIVHATGTGKSYLIAKISQYEYPKKIMIVSSSGYILDQQKKLIGSSNNIIYLTYQKLMNVNENDLIVKNVDILLLDEFHRAGAERWEKGVKTITNANKGIITTGFSATHIRHLDNKRNMVNELFDGNTISSLSLTKAISKKILPLPKYVSGIYSIDEISSKYNKDIINSNKATKSKKDECLDTLSGLMLNWKNFSNASKIIQDNFTKYTGKYIVFCESIEHLEIMKKSLIDWIQEAHSKSEYKNKECKIISREIHSEKNNTQNQNELYNFEKSKDDNLELLFSVDMLNEGKHIDDIDGVFLLRRTVSPTIFYQQIGRSFSATNREGVLIIDMVGNINSINKKLFSSELEQEIELENKRRIFFDIPTIDISGKIIDYSSDVLEILENIDSEIYSNIYSFDESYEVLKKYYNENGHVNVSKMEKYNDIDIGKIVNRIRIRYKKNNLSADQIERLNKIDFVFYKNKLIENNFILSLERFYIKHGHSNVPVNYIDEENIRLGSWVSNQRNQYSVKKISEERINKLNEYNFVWDALDEKHKGYIKALKSYIEREGHSDIPYNHMEEEKDLGDWAVRMRTLYSKGKMTEIRLSELKKLNFTFNKKDERFEIRFKLLEDYYKEHGKLILSVGYTVDGINLYNFIRSTRDKLNKGTCTIKDSDLQRLRSIGFYLDPNEPINKETIEETEKYLLKNGSTAGLGKENNKIYSRLLRLAKKYNQDPESIPDSNIIEIEKLFKKMTEESDIRSVVSYGKDINYQEIDLIDSFKKAINYFDENNTMRGFKNKFLTEYGKIRTANKNLDKDENYFSEELKSLISSYNKKVESRLEEDYSDFSM